MVGTWGGLTNISFKGIFLFNAVASLDYISLVGIVRPGGGGGVKANLIIFFKGGLKTN